MSGNSSCGVPSSCCLRSQTRPPARHGRVASRHCRRFGHWYDHISDPAARRLASFRAIDVPHHRVHEAGRQAALLLGKQDRAGAQQAVATMRQQSEQVLQHLDELGRDYPATIDSEAPMAAWTWVGSQ